jgi:DNA-binding XRE family transcriptional regulator
MSAKGWVMAYERLLTGKDLAAVAKRFRIRAKKSRAQAAREMEVSQTSIFHAEESPEQSLLKLRVKMIEAYSPFRLIGPLFFLQRK